MPARGEAIRRVAFLALLVCALLPGQAAAAPSTADRYSVVHGCFSLQAPGDGRFVAKAGGGYAVGSGRAGAERFRMKATSLGRYLLYGRARDFLAAEGGDVAPAAEPSDDSVWELRGARGRFTLRAVARRGGLARGSGGALELGRPQAFRFVAARGCARYPEIGTDASGRHARGATPYGEVFGTIDPHLHWSAFEFLGGYAHCGRPWHRFGAPYALVDCIDHRSSGGCAAVLEGARGSVPPCHSEEGWRSFEGWPEPASQTHEQTYYKWVERAWRGGVRLIVNDLVENEVLCEIYPLKRNPCDDMNSVFLQAKRMRQLQNYIDAQSGGPGKGWMRLVRNPFQARRVINQGKLAVVLGIELSAVFGCNEYNHIPECSKADIDRGLAAVQRIGVASIFPIHKFDNALGGVRFDGGTTGSVINLGQRYKTGHFWEVETCRTHEHDNPQLTAFNEAPDIIENGLFAFLPRGTTPVYPSTPHCNLQGLTSLGEYLVKRMIDRGMMIEVDHMSVRSRNETLSIARARRHSGVLATHSWSDEHSWPRIYRLGGFISPITEDSDEFIDEWRELRRSRRGDWYFGVGFGADSNGLHSQPGPRGADAPRRVRYPFRSEDGRVVFRRQRSGTRTFDVNTDGVAHYGLHPDWFRDMENLAGPAITRDLFRGAEAYLQTWERSVGVPRERCLPASRHFFRRGLGPVRLGMKPVGLLMRVGQPDRRVGRAYRWCVRGRRNKIRGAGAVAVFGAGERVRLVVANGRDNLAGGISRGTPLADLRDRGARPHGGGVWTRPAPGGTAFVYVVRGGRVVRTGVAASAAGVRGLLRAGRAR